MNPEMRRTQVDLTEDMILNLNIIVRQRAGTVPTNRARLIREAVAALIDAELGTPALPAARAVPPRARTVSVTRPAVLAR